MTTLGFFAPGWTTPRLKLGPVEESELPVDDSSDWSVDASQQEAEKRYGSCCEQKYDAASGAESN